ncbi:hypothetical protein KAR91_50190 [Candidatus Pacearchaeota archaeon]|nr:hypothetical protein [Candidatus Pacearchaeota archaeon]
MPQTRINLCQADYEGSVSGFVSDEELAAASGFLQVQIDNTITNAQNLGTGSGVFAQKTDTLLDFKSFVGGLGVDLTATTTEITIDTNEDAGLVAVQSTPPSSPSIGRVWLDTSSCASGVPQTLPVGHITSDYFPTFLDTVLLADASAGSFTVFLPTASGVNFGKTYHVKKIDATGNTITVQPSGSSTIDDATDQIMVSQYNSIMIISDGNDWFIL